MLLSLLLLSVSELSTTLCRCLKMSKSRATVICPDKHPSNPDMDPRVEEILLKAEIPDQSWWKLWLFWKRSQHCCWWWWWLFWKRSQHWLLLVMMKIVNCDNELNDMMKSSDKDSDSAKEGFEETESSCCWQGVLCS